MDNDDFNHAQHDPTEAMTPSNAQRTVNENVRLSLEAVNVDIRSRRIPDTVTNMKSILEEVIFCSAKRNDEPPYHHSGYDLVFDPHFTCAVGQLAELCSLLDPEGEEDTSIGDLKKDRESIVNFCNREMQMIKLAGGFACSVSRYCEAYGRVLGYYDGGTPKLGQREEHTLIAAAVEMLQICKEVDQQRVAQVLPAWFAFNVESKHISISPDIAPLVGSEETLNDERKAAVDRWGEYEAGVWHYATLCRGED